MRSFWFLALCTAGCGAAPPPPPPPPAQAAPAAVPAGPFAQDARLRWTADGRALLIADRWRLEPDGGSPAPLPLEVGAEDTLISAPEGPLAAVSPGRIRVVAGQTLEVPDWAPAPVRLAAAFVGADRIYVHQTGADGRVACRIRALAAAEWRVPPGGCLQAEGPITEIVRGPGALVGIRTAAALRLAYYDPRKGQAPLAAPALEPAARVSFAAAGGTAWVVAARAGEARRLAVDLLDGTVSDQGPAPAGAAAGPGGGLAWIENGSVCLGAGPAAARCVRP